jgi:predicted negative regulator of RcsB-dependent stress response
MPEIKHPAHLQDEKNPVEKFQHFWDKYGKQTGYALFAIILIVGGYLAYKYMISEPNEKKATEAMFRAEEYYRIDSANLALKGDNSSAGFLKIINKYGGTKAANLAGFYAGNCYMKLGDFNNAVKYLKDFSTSDKLVQIRAYGLLGDAYSELNKMTDGAEQYKKAGTYSDKDDLLSPEYLFRAGYIYESLGKKQDAIDMYQAVKNKYPNSPRGREVDKYLARLGVVAN